MAILPDSVSVSAVVVGREVVEEVVQVEGELEGVFLSWTVGGCPAQGWKLRGRLVIAQEVESE